MTDDIVVFIRARLDERANADWHARTCQTHQTMPPGTPFGLAGSPMSCNCGVPDLVEADVAVRRELVARYERLVATSEPDDLLTPVAVAALLGVLHTLASEHSTHPAYRSEWTP